ncbi:hypothetical protein N9Q18_00660 [bacterium]|nr:hypothetical protein [bacterium]
MKSNFLRLGYSVVAAVIAAAVLVLPGSGESVTAANADLVALAPARLMDTRPQGATIDNQFSRIGRRSAGKVTELKVTGRGGVQASASAVMLNVTATGASSRGFVTVWPCGDDKPIASTLNYSTSGARANGVLAKIGSGGKVCFYNSSAVELIVDVNGYTPGASLFKALAPARLLDTRPQGATIDNQFSRIGRRSAGKVTELKVTGRGGVPANASAVMLNVTATNASSRGYVTVWPCGNMPEASTLNYSTSGATANNALAKVGSGGKVCFYNSSAVELIVDVNGETPPDTAIGTLTPARLMDTRPQGATIDLEFSGFGRRSAGQVTQLTVEGRGGVPANSEIVVLNVTATGASSRGYVTVWPCGDNKPNASTLNYDTSGATANGVLAKIGSGGKVCFYNSSAVELIVDVTAADSSGLKFNFDGAAGLALGANGQRRSLDLPGGLTNASGQLNASNLARVASDGSLSAAIANGIADISQFLIAPNDKVYVVFNYPTDLADPDGMWREDGCLLAEIDSSTGSPTCIDDSLSGINWPYDDSYNDAIQFDDLGRIYYSGYDSNYGYVLRRYDNGSTKDLANENISVEDFLVQPDGSVFVTGYTSSTSAQWVRRITPTGGLETVVDTTSNFLRTFPDGNVYVGLWGSGFLGVSRYLTGDGELEAKQWIGNSDSYYYYAEFCHGDDYDNNFGFCNSHGSHAAAIHTTLDGNVYALAGYGADLALMRYFPVVDKPTTQVAKATMMQGVITNLILAGRDTNNKNIMTLLNTTNDQEQVLIGPDNEIEIYHLNYVADGNKVMFDGLRFSDNTYVIGQVNLSTGQATYSPTGTGLLVDFSTF